MILAAYYTHNRIRESLLRTSIQSVASACKHAGSDLVVCSWEPVPGDWKNIICPYKDNGLLNIIIQILMIMYKYEGAYNFISLCEHDCLYPHDYFTRLQKLIDTGRAVEGISNREYIGLNETGYLRVNQRDEPTSALSLEWSFARATLERKLKTFIAGGYCCIEPEDKSAFLRLEDGGHPMVHVNMNNTDKNHHLTSHYNVYEKDGQQMEHPYWGDYKKLNIFTECEMEQGIIQAKGITLIAARYGHPSGRMVPVRAILKTLAKNEWVTVCNNETGTDPCPGIKKQMRLMYSKNDVVKEVTVEENETVRLVDL
jgi:hypothetical protein